MMYQIVLIYLDAHPAQLDNAQRYVAQIEALGRGAAAEGLLAHMAMARQGEQMDSLSFMEAHVDAAFAADSALPSDTAKDYAYVLAGAYLARAHLAGRRGDGAAALSALREGAQILSTVRPQAVQLLTSSARRYTLFGKPAAPIQATYWFEPGSAESLATPARPSPGRASLLLFVDNHCADQCYTTYATLRRLAATYAARGLDITLVARTSGFYQNALVADPADEAKKLRAYFHDYLHLPGSLAVWATEFGHKADGRLDVRSAPNERAYKATTTQAVLIDPAGVIRYVALLGIGTETTWDHVIAATLPPSAR
jgi:hypothetical protein